MQREKQPAEETKPRDEEMAEMRKMVADMKAQHEQQEKKLKRQEQQLDDLNRKVKLTGRPSDHEFHFSGSRGMSQAQVRVQAQVQVVEQPEADRQRNALGMGTNRRTVVSAQVQDLHARINDVSEVVTINKDAINRLHQNGGGGKSGVAGQCGSKNLFKI